jgi:hypothetical protein
MPRDLALSDDRPSRAMQMLPALAPSTVWAQANREFGVGRIEQLPLRARLLDVLEHLDRGHMLALMGAAIPAVSLDRHPDIALLAGVLFTYRYVQIAGCHRDNPRVVYFTLSDAGRRKLAEGRDWWNRLSLWQRLRVRLFG